MKLCAKLVPEEAVCGFNLSHLVRILKLRDRNVSVFDKNV